MNGKGSKDRTSNHKAYRDNLDKIMHLPKNTTVGQLYNPIEEMPSTLEEWKHIAESLWDLLDKIDTASDMFKPEVNAYYKYVDKIAYTRNRYLFCDGQKLTYSKMCKINVTNEMEEECKS